MTVTTDQKRSLEEDFKNLLISTPGKGIRYFIKTYIINNENNYYNRNNKNKNNRNEMIKINSFRFSKPILCLLDSGSTVSLIS